MAYMAPLVMPVLFPLQASIVGSNDYRHWRQYGVAFGIREGTYDVPNRTHASGHVFNVVSGKRKTCVLLFVLFPIWGRHIEPSFPTFFDLMVLLIVGLCLAPSCFMYNISSPQSWSSFLLMSTHFHVFITTSSSSVFLSTVCVLAILYLCNL